MPTKQEYQELISEIIKKQVSILGPDIAIQRASQIDGLKVDSSGKVVSLKGDEQTILQRLIDQYIELSGQIVKNVLRPVFQKYPSIEVDIK